VRYPFLRIIFASSTDIAAAGGLEVQAAVLVLGTVPTGRLRLPAGGAATVVKH
jgi:hypothetical protein